MFSGYVIIKIPDSGPILRAHGLDSRSRALGFLRRRSPKI